MLLDYIRERISPQNPLLLLYHKIISFFSALIYGFPARNLKVIAVTGTNGKTTTIHLIAKILETAGKKIGLLSSIAFQIGDKKWINDTKQTTLGRFRLQKLLKQMASESCDFVIMEVTSHALIQSRISGIPIYCAVLTNVTGDHLEYHGSFEAYRSAKMKLFENAKISVLPKEDPSFDFFNVFEADKKTTYGVNKGDVTASNIHYFVDHVEFDINYNSRPEARRAEESLNLPPKTYPIVLKAPGFFNVNNALAAAACISMLGFSFEIIQKAFKEFEGMPGRYESIDAGQNFKIIVDYAHTPDALFELCKFYRDLTKGKLIIVFGATGGGRDKAKRPKMGEAVCGFCDIIIVTDDDPYTEDRVSIIEQVASGVKPDKTLFKILGREEAIKHAVSLAKQGDTLIIAGKGCEPIQIIGREKIKWDDRQIVKSLLKNTTSEVALGGFLLKP